MKRGRGALVEMTGRIIGALRVVGREANTRYGHSSWRCQCTACGRETTRSGTSLRQPGTAGRCPFCHYVPPRDPEQPKQPEPNPPWPAT